MKYIMCKTHATLEIQQKEKYKNPLETLGQKSPF